MTWRAKVRTSLLYLVAIVAGFALSYLVVAFVVFPSGVVPHEVKVPNVTGLSYDEALLRLTQAGFKGEQGEQRYNNSAPKMTVLEQSPPPGSREGFDVGDATESPSNSPRGSVIATRPAAGTQVSVPSTISLVLSGGAPTIEMPMLIGRDVDAARQTLQQLGVRDVKLVWDPMAIGARGSVVGQSPVGGATLLPGGSVQLRVAGDGAATP